MMKALLLYIAWRYGNIGTNIITEQFITEFPLSMEGYHMGLMVPEKHINKHSMSPGFLPPYMNGGSIIK